MTDLTAIKTPFGLLDDATREALRAHGGPWEIWSGTVWAEPSYPGRFDGWYTYRVKPQPPKPREWWLNPQTNVSFIALEEDDGAKIPAGFVRVREVTD